MILFTHIISGILLTFACYLWYFTGTPFIMGTMIFLFSVFPINLFTLFGPKEKGKNSTIKQNLIGSTVALSILGAGFYFIVSNKEDYFFALFKNAYFLSVFWFFMICGIAASYKKIIKAQQTL